MIVIKPNPGPQTKFLQSSADIVIYGGARGGGKSWALLFEVLRYCENSRFTAVLFRRTFPQVAAQGGLWDKSNEMFPLVSAIANKSNFKWTFTSGANCSFAHMKDEQHKFNWQGAEICYLGYDELTHFSQSQFLFMMAANRSTCGVKPFIRATCNPDATSWVKNLIAPWLLSDGYCNPELSGVKKYFIVENNDFQFVPADYRNEDGLQAKSLTYISADVWDNPKLLQANPDYVTSLRSLPLIERERFLGIRGRGGNWNIKAEAGKVFQEQWFQKTQLVSYQHGDQLVRFWDFAASLATARRSDFTVGVLLLKRGDRYFVLDMVRLRLPPTQANTLVLNTARADGNRCQVRWQVEPGASGVRDSANLQTLLAGFDARGVTETRDKVSRAMSSSAGFESATIQLCYGEWNQVFINELVNFPDGDHDDIVDAVTGGYNCLTGFKTGVSNFTY